MVPTKSKRNATIVLADHRRGIKRLRMLEHELSLLEGPEDIQLPKQLEIYCLRDTSITEN